MKHNLSLLVGAALLGLASGAVAATAVTDPVGYITAGLASNEANSPSGVDSIVAPTLVQKTEFAGSTTASPSGGFVATFASGVPVIAEGDAGLYYLEITGGAGVPTGWWSSLLGATTGTTITLENKFPDGLPANVTIAVRKHNTLATFLGANSAGLRTVEESAASPDRVLILDPVTQVVSQFIYSTTVYGAPGFYNEVSEAASNNKIIYPGTGVIIRRLSAGVKNVVVVGHVKTTPTQIDIEKGDNIVESMLATGTNLSSSGLDSGSLLTGLNREDYNAANGAADQVLILSPSQVISQFIALSPTAPATHAFIDQVSENDANNAPILAEGTAFILRRDTSLSTGTWTAPAQVISTNP